MRDFILADNQDITREGLRSVIDRTGVARTVSECADRAALAALLADNASGVVVLDYALFDFYGIEQLLNLASRYHKSSWLIFSDELGRAFIRGVCSREQFSVVMKTETLGVVSRALVETAAYRPYRCELASRILREDASAPENEKLTPAEVSILREIATGRTTKEIAAGRFLSFHTVNSHRKNIFRKLGVNNVQEAIRYALRAGIIDMADYNI